MTSIEFHVHPYLWNNHFTSIADAMHNAGLDVLALETLDSSVYPVVKKLARKSYPSASIFSEGVKLPNGKFVLNAREYNTKEKLHLLSVGYSYEASGKRTEIRKIIDSCLEEEAIVILDHPFVDNGLTRLAGHIPVSLEHEVEKLCREYSGKVMVEWNSYCPPQVRKFLMKSLNLAGFGMKYYDVNEKVEELSSRLRAQDYNVPVVADTDLHARSTKHLGLMGTSRIITEAQGESPGEIISSIKQNIFNGDFQNVKNYVPFEHLLQALMLPVLFPFCFKKPRS